MTHPITDLALLAESISDQPELFAAPDVSSVRAAREYAHTGNWTVKDGRRVALIVSAWLNTGSLRKTAQLCSVSRNTVSAVLRILENAGKLEPLKERFARARLEVGMEQLAWMEEIIASRDIEAAQVLKAGWVGVGIVSDKEAAAPPAAMHLHVHQVATADADPVREYERLLRAARATVVDVESAASGVNTTPNPTSEPSVTALDTTSTASEPSPPLMPPSTTEGGGGGHDPLGGPDQAMGNP